MNSAVNHLELITFVLAELLQINLHEMSNNSGTSTWSPSLARTTYHCWPLSGVIGFQRVATSKLVGLDNNGFNYMHIAPNRTKFLTCFRPRSLLRFRILWHELIQICMHFMILWTVFPALRFNKINPTNFTDWTWGHSDVFRNTPKSSDGCDPLNWWGSSVRGIMSVVAVKQDRQWHWHPKLPEKLGLTRYTMPQTGQTRPRTTSHCSRPLDL